MRKAICFLFVFLACLRFDALAEENCSLKLIVQNQKNSKGTLRVALWNNAKGFLDEKPYAMAQEKGTKGGVIEIGFRDIVCGKYAISLFLDENGNRQLDANSFGSPVEPYGFSNNAVGFMEPPSYSQAEFETIKGEEKRISIRLIN